MLITYSKFNAICEDVAIFIGQLLHCYVFDSSFIYRPFYSTIDSLRISYIPILFTLYTSIDSNIVLLYFIYLYFFNFYFFQQEAVLFARTCGLYYYYYRYHYRSSIVTFGVHE